jgi:Rrf2 family protein
MTISAKAHYACLAMLDLAVHDASVEPLAVRQIAARHDIPSAFLTQILQQLRGAGLVRSTRGSQGGYRLAKPADRIRLSDICQAVTLGASDGPQDSDTGESRLLNHVWMQAAAAQQCVLEQHRLSDLARRCTPSDASMFYI